MQLNHLGWIGSRALVRLTGDPSACHVVVDPRTAALYEAIVISKLRCNQIRNHCRASLAGLSEGIRPQVIRRFSSWYDLEK